MLHLTFMIQFKNKIPLLYFIGTLIIILNIGVSCKTATFNKSEVTSLIVIDSLGSDTNISNKIRTYKTKLDSSMKEVIGYSEQMLEKGTPESLLGNFFSDILLEHIKLTYTDSIHGLAAMSLLNNGGFRTSLPKGEILIEHIFQLMPFDNEVVILEVKGSTLMKLFYIIAQKGGMPVGGLRIILEATSWKSAKIDRQEVVRDGNYILITSDYLATGGDGLDFLSENTRYIRTGLLVRDVFIECISNLTKQGRTINPQKDGRISYE